MRADATVEARAAFAERVAGVVWPACEPGDAAFTVSPQALVEWAPVAPELKEYDAEIVANSLRFKWENIRNELAQCLDGPAVIAAWRTESDGPVTAG
jgi:hypothetical protein